VSHKLRFALLTGGALLFAWGFPLNGADKTPVEIIEAGTAITVRTIDDIRADRSDGRIFSGEIEQNVRDSRGTVTLPRGADVELLIRRTGEREYTLDIESVTANGRRMAVDAPADQAVVGVLVGALTWGGSRNVMINSDLSVIPRIDVQMAARGSAVKLPPQTVVVFRLDKPLRAGVADTGFSRNGRHFHAGFGATSGNTRAFDAGLAAGRNDRQRNLTSGRHTGSWSGVEQSEYQAGYDRGFNETPVGAGAANRIQIGADHTIRWNGPPASQVYVRVDNRKRLFSADESGAQPAPWIRHGHKYVFTLVDQNGKEIARDENDLRVRRVK
jgi:hypothetical protein